MKNITHMCAWGRGGEVVSLAFTSFPKELATFLKEIQNKVSLPSPLTISSDLTLS